MVFSLSDDCELEAQLFCEDCVELEQLRALWRRCPQLLQTMVAALDDGREWLLVDPFDGRHWFGLGVGQNGGQLFC